MAAYAPFSRQCNRHAKVPPPGIFPKSGPVPTLDKRVERSAKELAALLRRHPEMTESVRRRRDTIAARALQLLDEKGSSK